MQSHSLPPVSQSLVPLESEQSQGTGLESLRRIRELCEHHLSVGSEAEEHYRKVCRALVSESVELALFLEKAQKQEELQNMRNTKGLCRGCEGQNGDFTSKKHFLLDQRQAQGVSGLEFCASKQGELATPTGIGFSLLFTPSSAKRDGALARPPGTRAELKFLRLER